jgi:hypothetical protein
MMGDFMSFQWQVWNFNVYDQLYEPPYSICSELYKPMAEAETPDLRIRPV